MQKKKVFKIEDSNIEGIGTDADTKCRESAAATEKAWKKVKKAPGLYAWRIEKFKVKVNQDAKSGILYDDDSYIIMNIYKDKDTPKLFYDIHFWLGTTTSQDEAGTAAYKTVELDDFLGGDPIQHREVSGHESRLFMSYFPKGLRLLSGGVASGFNHVEPEAYKPRLLWLKGKKRVRVQQVEMLISKLNTGDVFILDAGENIYQFQGKACGLKERSKGAELGQALDDERKNASVHVFRQGEKYDEDVHGMFFSYFQEDLKGEDIKEGTPVPEEKCQELMDSIGEEASDDAAWEKCSDKVLMQLSEQEDGEMKFTEVEKGTLTKSNLDTNDVFIVDVGSSIFVWIGSGASTKEKSKGMTFASKYLKENDRPMFLPVTQIFESGENEVFNSHFDN